ncbi:hypothetical protein A2617_04695 [Candidatus Daviesbacteria bacterium RIFOXYD1_FULL_41_10]|uniref:Uncharacterized protein n=3 Tax=Patescibacteria group TaxID=1783273 RepID=A0A1F5N1Q5_9BACT|nr:MAG: hypothetical protein UU67_C0058G0002 [Candidatus Daviesbacteria bacterium GW2011_GWB1_41_5]KKT81590.1 MAG: hypothetical protein UW78_C0007G0012 [Candidatus Azambacteria bacterium GW2011_GWA1_44_9]OGE71555.1 MAG: hypothetical protein A2617_04695 [Candidatus Daviesbacteria bacterium RIFOXYD1_FULL_41_10]
MANNELSPTEAEKLWEKMDDQGYAGGMGSNKPKATQIVQEAYGEDVKRGQPLKPDLSDELQSPLMPMTETEQRGAAIRATERRQQPDGRYRRKRVRSTGIQSPIDGASHMSGINEVGMRRALSRR